MESKEPWVDVDDVSSYLKVNKETIRRWIKDKGFPAHRAGNLLRFRLSHVDEWIRESDVEENPANENIDS